MPDITGAIEEQAEQHAIQAQAHGVTTARMRRLWVMKGDFRYAGREEEFLRLPTFTPAGGGSLVKADGTRKSQFGIDQLGSGFVF